MRQTGNVVKLDKLVKQLRRDLLANPKKSAVLGLMLLVALYFWGPLVWNWIAPAGSKKGTRHDQTALILVDDPVEPGAPTKASKAKTFRWEKVRQQIQGDRMMVPAAFETTWHDPFAVPQTQPTREKSPTEETPGESTTEAVSREVVPSEAGLKLASVAIGPRRRTATINGETYREGALVRVSGTVTKAAPVEFRLVRIERERVELERGGKTWWLGFDQSKLAQGDEIERTPDSEPMP